MTMPTQRIPTRGNVGNPTFVTERSSLIKDPFDFIGVDYPDGTTEVYTFRAGGASGQIVSVLTIVYTDSNKASLVSLTKS